MRKLFVFLLMISLSFSCAEKVENEVSVPEFHLELVKLVNIDRPVSYEKMTALSICVSEKDSMYLHEHYSVSLEMIYGDMSLYDVTSYDSLNRYVFSPVDELDSETSIRLYDIFNVDPDDHMIDKGYSSFVLFYVGFDELDHKDYNRFSFRIKLHFPVTGETYYTGEYTLVVEWLRYIPKVGDVYGYALIPGIYSDTSSVL